MGALALQTTVADMVAEYEEKSAALASEIEAFKAATARMLTATGVNGAFGGDIWWRGSPDVDERAATKALLTSGWKAIYERLNIGSIASAKDKALWEQTIADPPPLTAENAFATFGPYLLNTRFHILRGLAEAFCVLDPAYRSHSKVKIGVRGLPKRVILTNVSRTGWGRERLVNILNALAAYRGQPLVTYDEMRSLDGLSSYDGSKAGVVDFDGTNGGPDRGVSVKKFQNGNAHLFFTPDTLREINLALAEFYGDVLPDAEGEEPGKPAPSTAVARDLQFYPTPEDVIDTIMREAGIEHRDTYWNRSDPLFVLEPSCGDGRIMDEILRRGHQVMGVEVHAGRAAEARRKGHAVVIGNFLEHPGHGEFDRVVMNPPFYGRHYLHHIRHAMGFLKPGGVLVSVLPATAWYDHGEIEKMGGKWDDLPVGSFAESGTNIPTGYWTWRKAR